MKNATTNHQIQAYPVSWHLIPANIYTKLRFAYSVYVNPSVVKLEEYLQTHGIMTPVDTFTVYRPNDLAWEAGFPLTIVPENVTAVGPIILASASAAEQDPGLAAWI
ncbi:hypothetical protein Vi05172_g631 [Venturia inaequalis]|nr:hypothetical protein Vi05172_g631 [Venturia inaequalis]